VLDKESRDKLRDKLKGISKKASSKVITEVKAEQGDFKVVLSPKQIDHFYKNEKVASIPVSDLDDDIIQYVQGDPEQCVALMLDESCCKRNEIYRTAINSFSFSFFPIIY